MNSILLRCRPSDVISLLFHHLRTCRFSERCISDMRILTFSRSYSRIGKELTAIFTITPDKSDENCSILRLSIAGISPESSKFLVRHLCAGELAETVKFDLGASRDMLGSLMKALEAYKIA